MFRNLLLTVFLTVMLIGVVMYFSEPEPAVPPSATYDATLPAPETAGQQGAEESLREQAVTDTEEPTLTAAIRSKRVDEVKRLLDRGADPNGPLSDKGLSPLFEAVRRGKSKIVQALLKAGANAETEYRNDKGEIHSAYSYAALYGTNYVLAALMYHGRDNFGDGFMPRMQRLVCSPEYCGNVLTMAALHGRQRPQNIFYLRSDEDKKAYLGLLRLQGVERNHGDIRGRPVLPPLHAAAVKARTITIENLLLSGADMDLRDEKGMTASDYARANDLPVIVALFEAERSARQLVAAVESGDPARVGQLLDAGSDPDNGGVASPRPHALAAGAGHVEVARLLLERGANVNLYNQHGRVPIIFAIDAGNLAVVKLLLANKARVDGEVLRKAAASGNIEIVRAFLDAGADLTGRPYDSGPQPIHTAIQKGHTKIVRILAEAGADVHAEWTDAAQGNHTTLSDAIENGRTDIALELIDRGADTDALICPGEDACITYLVIAAYQGDATLVRRLIKAGNKVRRTRQDLMVGDSMVAWSPLTAAAQHGNPEVIAILLENGADASLRDSYNCSALDYAIINKRTAAAELLRKADGVADKAGCGFYR